VRDALIVWLWRRNVALVLVAGVALTCVAAVVTGAVPTPQLRGPSVLLGVSTIHALLLGAALPLAVIPADGDLEPLSPRPVRRYRLLTGAGLLCVDALLLAGVGAVAGLDRPTTLAALRSLVLAAAVGSFVTRSVSFPAAIAVLLTYVGCVLFAGVEPDGTVASWARLLAPWHPGTDPWLTAAAVIATVGAFAARPRPPTTA
jgi:hypothetical protein